MSPKRKLSKNSIAVYPGTFDPITKGHMDLVRRVLILFDKVVIVVAHNSRKKTLFSVKERVDLIKDCFKQNPEIEVISYEGLTVDLLKKINASVIIRGLRAVTDFDYEFQLALTNRTLDSHIETVFFVPDEKYTYLNSTVVKEIAQFGGKLSHFVTTGVASALRKKLKQTI